MSALPAAEFAPLDADAYKHAATLLKAQHCAYPVQFEGKERFVQVIHSRLAGGRIEMDVWLTGSSARVDPSELTVATRPA